jgi:hypothetical protein
MFVKCQVAQLLVLWYSNQNAKDTSWMKHFMGMIDYHLEHEVFYGND